MPKRRLLRVVKVGGSLLDLDDLAHRLRRWLVEESEASSVLVVGGGHRVDLIRAQRRKITDAEAHWRAIDAMLANARALSGQLPEAVWFDRIREVQACGMPLGFLNSVSFMRYDDPRHSLGALPASWSVTSDSIAARAADLAEADELVLLKSASPPASGNFDELAAAGYLDPCFPTAVRNVARVRFVNLREVYR